MSRKQARDRHCAHGFSGSGFADEAYDLSLLQHQVKIVNHRLRLLVIVELNMEITDVKYYTHNRHLNLLAYPVAEKAEAQHHENDHQAGAGAHKRRRREIGLRLGKHSPETGLRRLYADAKIA